MSDQHQPTAKRGIRGTVIADDREPVQPFLSPPDAASMVRDPNQAGKAETTLVNTTQTAVVDPLVQTSFLPAEQGINFTDGGGEGMQLQITDVERISTIREALHAHRAMLCGLLARKQGESSLNPASFDREIGAISRGIARCEQLLREIAPEQEAGTAGTK